MDTKILVICLDGATLDLIIPWVQEEKLPTFKKLMKEGVSGKLKSTIPPKTCPAVNCFETGLNPGKLGIYDFTCRVPGSYEFKLYYFIKSINAKSLWDIVSDHGKKVGVLNVPTIISPYRINGFMVTGWLCPSPKECTSPKELKLELDEITNGYEIDVSVRVERSIEHAFIQDFAFNEERFLNNIYRITEKRFKAIKHLLNKHTSDLFIAFFTGTDRIQHYMWHHMDPKHPQHIPKKGEKYHNEILKYYQLIDQMLEELIKGAGEDTIIIVMSDHGFGPVYKFFYVNEWLKRTGLLKTKSRSPPLNIISKIGKRMVTKFVSFVAKTYLEKVFKKIYIKLPKSLNEFIPLYFRSNLRSLRNIDWSKTKAYSASELGGICINLKGREPQGTVKPGKEYEELRNYIIDQLKSLCTHFGMNVTTFKREEIYWGPYINEAPDIFFFIDELRCMPNITFWHGPLIIDSIYNPANHRLNGIFMAIGKGIKQGKTINARIIDLAPTILHILDIPIPKYMDGKVLKGIFEPDFELATKKIKYQKISKQAEKEEDRYVFSKTEEEEIKERLKRLGYLG